MSSRAIEREEESGGAGTRAMHWGVMTWIGNIGGCLVGMVPIALPVSVVLIVVTLFTGIWAMVLGVRAQRASKSQGDLSNARIGFWLGAAHILIVVLFGVGAYFGVEYGYFEDLGVLPTE